MGSHRHTLNPKGPTEKEIGKMYIYIYIVRDHLEDSHIYCAHKTKTKRKEEEGEEKDKVLWR